MFTNTYNCLCFCVAHPWACDVKVVNMLCNPFCLATYTVIVVDVRQFCIIRVISLICFIDICICHDDRCTVISCKYYWLLTQTVSYDNYMCIFWKYVW